MIERDWVLFTEIARRVRNRIDLLEVASLCRVTSMTIKKVLQARPISPCVEKKIRIGLGLERPAKPSFGRRPSTVERLLKVYRLYQEMGTLAAVGRTMRLSRERVRQLLVLGDEVGLFQYRSGRLLPPSTEKVLYEHYSLVGPGAAAESSRFSTTHLNF